MGALPRHWAPLARRSWSITAAASAKAGTSIYSATKAALDSLTHVLSRELGARQIRVNSLSPGPTETEGTRAIGAFESDMGSPSCTSRPMKSIEASPTIADVHPQPADELGEVVGNVLHVGTGYPRLMITTVDTCQGPRAYAGVAFAYHEQVTTNYERLTDQAWAAQLASGPKPKDVPGWRP